MTTVPVANPVLAEIWRGPILESVHRGAAVICRADGEVVAAWGDPARITLPRSACKMVQALPLVESGAADQAGLRDDHLALACASHQGSAIHSTTVSGWLDALGLAESDLRCGTQRPSDPVARQALREANAAPDQTHNNCSGKHSGFLTLNRHLGGPAEYIDLAHPVQQAIKAASAEMCDEELEDHAIDGCSAPNFAMSLRGLALSVARFADPSRLGPTRQAAALRLRDAMAANPVMVAGEGKATTELIRSAAGRAVVKGGAEGVFVAILPEQGLGIALKCDDGNRRGAEAAITALMAHYGYVDRAGPVFARYADGPITNWRGIAHGHLRAGPDFLSPRI